MKSKSEFFHFFMCFSIVVDLCRKTLVEAGFVEISEKADWCQNQLQKSGKV